MNSKLETVSTTLEAKESTIAELNEQTEVTIQKLVETEAQKEFMRYAFLQEPKSELGKLVSGAWKKFKSWWDKHQRPKVEEATRESIQDRLEKFKKQAEENKKSKTPTPKKRGINR